MERIFSVNSVSFEDDDRRKIFKLLNFIVKATEFSRLWCCWKYEAFDEAIFHFLGNSILFSVIVLNTLTIFFFKFFDRFKLLFISSKNFLPCEIQQKMKSFQPNIYQTNLSQLEVIINQHRNPMRISYSL